MNKFLRLLACTLGFVVVTQATPVYAAPIIVIPSIVQAYQDTKTAIKNTAARLMGRKAQLEEAERNAMGRPAPQPSSNWIMDPSRNGYYDSNTCDPTANAVTSTEPIVNAAWAQFLIYWYNTATHDPALNDVVVTSATGTPANWAISPNGVRYDPATHDVPTSTSYAATMRWYWKTGSSQGYTATVEEAAAIFDAFMTVPSFWPGTSRDVGNWSWLTTSKMQNIKNYVSPVCAAVIDCGGCNVNANDSVWGNYRGSNGTTFYSRYYPAVTSSYAAPHCPNGGSLLTQTNQCSRCVSVPACPNNTVRNKTTGACEVPVPPSECPATGGWTYQSNGNICTRPACIGSQIRNIATGACESSNLKPSCPATGGWTYDEVSDRCQRNQCTDGLSARNLQTGKCDPLNPNP